MLQFYICYHKNYYATLMLLEKLCYMKININFREQAWNKHPAKDWVKEYRGLLFSQSSRNIHTLRSLACLDSSA